MKSMKKILSLVIALAMVLSIAPLAMAAGDDGMGGVETEYFWDDFQSVEAPEGSAFPLLIDYNKPAIGGWADCSSTTSSKDHKFEIAQDGNEKYLQHHPEQQNIYVRKIRKALSGTISEDSNVRISLKLKHNGSTSMIGMNIFGLSFVFRTSHGKFYYGGGGQFDNAFVANKWNNIELLLKNGTDNDSYEYYLEGKKISSGDLPSKMTEASFLEIATYDNNKGGGTHTANKYVYIDDIRITTVDEKKICELAAEKINIPSSATGNITLPQTVDFGGATISWSSDNTKLISNEGVVTRPENGEIQPVTLTATVTYGQTSVAFPYTVNVLPESVYFYDDFEGGAVGKLAGYNSWTEYENTAYTHAFTGQVIQETVSNKAGMIWREANPTGSNTAGPAQYYVSRTFDNAITDGIVSVRMNLYFDDSVWANITLSDGAKSETLQFKANTSTIYYSKTNTNIRTDVHMPFKVWHELEYRVDLPNKTLEIIFNGRSLYTIENIALNGVSSIRFEENRTGLNGSTSTNEKFYFDNIVAQLLDVPYAYSVVDFAFKGADGKAALYPEADGSVSGVTIKKHKSAENAALIAAVYDGGKLTKASAPIDISGALINAETTYSVNLPIASAATQIRVFALDKGTLVPLALDKTYEKRSPITVFIAGDSMAEKVAIDNGTLGYQREGWGMRIGEQFADSSITVANRAIGGRDTAEFISEGRLNSILASGQRGDFVFVSFGHNDDGSNITLEDYRANLASYSQAIKEKGMTPIFVTSISRIDTGADDSENWAAYDDDLDTYADAMVKEAAENGDVCLDLYTAFNNALSGKTYAEAREYYVPKTVDGTHLVTEGAKLVAELIADLLANSASTLKDLLK